MKQVNSQRKERRIIRMAELRAKYPLSESHIYWLIKKGKFPKPFSLVPGGRAKGWFEDTIDDHLTSCEVNSMGGE
jgi:prophage regulatory protein